MEVYFPEGEASAKTPLQVAAAFSLWTSI